LVFEATGVIEYLELRFPRTGRLITSYLPFAAEVQWWHRLLGK